MSTERQKAANKLNAQKSTGPTSTAGKAKSCLNHLSHGFASSTARLIHGEDPEELKALVADLMAEHQPATPTEQILVERMAESQWLTQRAFRLQTEAFSLDMFRIDAKFVISKNLGVLIRYRTSADNAFHKAHNELLKAQKERKKSEIGFESQEVSADPADKTENDPEIVPITPDEIVFSPEPALASEETARQAIRILKKAV